MVCNRACLLMRSRSAEPKSFESMRTDTPDVTTSRMRTRLINVEEIRMPGAIDSLSSAFPNLLTVGRWPKKTTISMSEENVTY